ncbi:MAG: coproporphyrinogen dehydrogenase HemZ [Oscillospiraceae bacterium]|nr:coproporphyrinogen dehydrogenase HemZ [Oscillospiraceae bacterium]
MEINAPDNASKDLLYNLMNIYFPGISEVKVDASVDEIGGEVYAHTGLSGSINTEGSYSCLISSHFTSQRVRSLALGRAFYACAEKLTNYRAPFGILTGVRPAKIALFYLSHGLSVMQTENILCRDYLIMPEKAGVLIRAAEYESELSCSLSDSDCFLYISIPFCPTRCAYCSFISSAAPHHLKLIPKYLDTLKKELCAVGEIMRRTSRRLRGVYVGGGTPGILTVAQTDGLLDVLEASFDLSGCVEITYEIGRPDTVTVEKLETLKKHGVGRISINPQSTNDDVLKAIGRNHTADDFYEAFEEAKKTGFTSINSDIITGLPGDSEKGVLKTLSDCISLGAENITVHSLCKKRSSDMTISPSDIRTEEVAGLNDMCKKLLYAQGYESYYIYRQKNAVGNGENTGFALKDHICEYNIAMMEDMCSVLSCGAGAVTKLVNKGMIERLYSYKYPTEYLSFPDKTNNNLKKLESNLDRNRKPTDVTKA